ncbi:xanthine dehydrogenase family protein molybdopterin-binding subunit [Novipirellula artificiosorum]|uniref:Nicotinate dehydrogenase subunit B n=1 Tax=Novipirellula artificiosorum TaxID=2528016 RepID=A0A5C6DPY3_9BACT|nr:molybdopterin cofactor-binding domain-containing protein [Novipirellula artificiosorum]TWU38234.1 Nicotinate dehydrogenase subunit B [Novipirellula artificiosorum]
MVTAGSRTTPSTVPVVRQGAATARRLLVEMAAQHWNVETDSLSVAKGIITHRTSERTLRYADLSQSAEIADAFQQNVAPDIELTPRMDWTVIGSSVVRPNLRDLVTSTHRYPSDITLPEMLYGKILRPPSYGATLKSIDFSPAEAMPDVVVVRDGAFIGFAAPTTYRAAQALDAVASTARWETVSHPSSDELFDYLKQHVRPGRAQTRGDIAKAVADAHQVLEARYEVAYVQHAPMEPRAATARWQDGKLTVWTGVDGPQRVQGDLARSLGIPTERVRVIVPDMGGGFGGKHTGEAAEEAARLARAARCPVAVHWTRAEEFTWAYFRPAALIESQAALDQNGRLTAWDFTNINAGGSAIDPPYQIPCTRVLSSNSESPLRQGAYRGLAATANNFARESFIDELAQMAAVDPLQFRLQHLQDSRIRTVLEVAAQRFDWATRRAKVTPEIGVGLACGTEKNSVVAACVEVRVDRRKGEFHVSEVCEAFECGPIQNPANLTSQVQGCIMMGMGAASREAIEFKDGKITNAAFSDYRVPRFRDLPKIDVHLVDNTEIPSAGAGETPIIAIAPAIANAIFAATGTPVRSMPIRLPSS